MIQSEKSDIQFIIMTDSQLIEWFWNEWSNQQLKISVLNSSPPCPDLDSYLDEVLEKAGRRGRVFLHGQRVNSRSWNLRKRLGIPSGYLT